MDAISWASSHGQEEELTTDHGTQPIIVKFVSLESNPSMPFSHLGKLMGCSRLEPVVDLLLNYLFLIRIVLTEKANFKGNPSNLVT